MRQLGRFWRWSATWSRGWQIAFAIFVILVIAGILGALVPSNARSTRAGSATSVTEPTGSTTTTDATVAPTTTPGAHATPKTSATTVPRLAPPTTLRRTPASSMTAAPQAPQRTNGLVALTIAPASHEDTYQRDDFGNGWNDADHDCQNTRAEVLISESQTPVTFSSARDCTVATGKWVDPWSGLATTVAHDFDIDHMVPLANAWRSGAWAWSAAMRVAYANDLGDAAHLNAINASENRQKSDDGPEAWRPPNAGSWCRYALDWDNIKAKWHLAATPGEWSALTQMVSTC